MQVCVNPFFDTYEDCQQMRLTEGAIEKVPRVGSQLDYGLFNFELEDHESFKKSGTTTNELVAQTLHSDHRRYVEKGRFNKDGSSLKQDHIMWHNIQDWEAAGKASEQVPVPADAALGPLSFLSAALPGTSILLTSKTTGNVEEVEVPLGCFVGFGGHEIHGGNRYKRFHRRLHVYANVLDLRFLPISRAESLWVLAAASKAKFNKEYMDVLRMRALECLDVYEFD
jgi:hypothetical protein